MQSESELRKSSVNSVSQSDSDSKLIYKNYPPYQQISPQVSAATSKHNSRKSTPTIYDDNK